MSFIVFGIGCISYAIFNIWPQSGYYANNTQGGYVVPNVATTEINKIKENSARPIETNPSQDMSAPNKALYPEHIAEGDNIGSLSIPVLDQKLPIIQGTGAAELKKGVGHFTQSVLPGEEDNCVISGHRDTVFRKIGKLKIGDELIVQTAAGKFTYEVSGTRIVHENDKTVIVPLDHAVLTLTTCYPFNFIGSAPDRYIVSADLAQSR
ncbi:MAG: class D sortase [Clostridium sp.]|uniref:class D sortase n=1 Tax=Clostridium sp. TaxID=1506 RepID=UPI003D6CE5A4